jgi:hypothetical protein
VQEPCAGVDQGDGFDCYGQPVGDNVSPYYSETQKAALWTRLTSGDTLTLTEIASIRNGLFGQAGITWLSRRNGGAQPLPTVHVTASRANVAILLALLYLVSRRS